MSKILTAYFSASGTTERAAIAVAGAAGADLYEIMPVVPYTNADLDWMNKKSRSTVEMNDPEARPEIKGRVENMAQYDIVFLGFPIWWYREPSIIDTFLEAYDFSGKTIVPFATSGGSGLGSTARGLKKYVSGDTRVLEGRLLNGIQDEASLKKWIEEIK